MTPLYFLLNDEGTVNKYDLQTYLVEHDGPIDSRVRELQVVIFHEDHPPLNYL